MHSILELQAASAMGAVLFILLVRRLLSGKRIFSEIGFRINRLLQRKTATALVVTLAVASLRIFLLGVSGVPRPAVVDEFSYLFMADTFLRGRMANPPHPLWTHLESIFILSHPTYSSIYPVAQGLFLATGKLLTGVPWSGVLLSAALMCGTLCWMLQAWFPSQWALFGTLLAALQFGLSSYWMNSYWGGAVACTGGALTLGALRRLQLRNRLTDSALFGLGLSILAASRPYEGFVLAITVMTLLAFSRRSRKLIFTIRKILPAIGILSLTTAAMLAYFYQVTGDPFLIPSQAYINQYAIVPAFVWQKLRTEPVYQHAEIREAMLSFLPDYQRYATAAGFAGTTARKFLSVANFLLGPMMLVVAGTLPRLVRSKKMMPLYICIATGLFAIAVVVPFQIHYAAPIAPAVIALEVQSFRYLWALRKYGYWIGSYLVPAAPLFSLGIWLSALPSAAAPGIRDVIMNNLQSQGGRHLVFVRHRLGRPLPVEWIFNGPDIDREPVVWARDYGLLQDQIVINYFRERRVWMIDQDEEVPHLMPWQGAAGHKEN